MNDIKIPSKDEGSQKPGFILKHLNAAAQSAPAEAKNIAPVEQEPSTKVKVHFDKFVQLIATHDFESVMPKYGKEDIVLSTNLLTELANAYPQEERSTTKMPIILIVGIIIGVIATYVIVRL